MEESLALEMLKELKAQNKRQHVIIIVLIAVILLMAIGFFVYERQFETITEQSTMEQSQEETNNSSIIGEIN